jgi:hypothetical protein
MTVYLLNGGLLEYAQQTAAHESARTTKLYDRRNDRLIRVSGSFCEDIGLGYQRSRADLEAICRM